MLDDRPILYVEGPNDCHAIINLMMSHGMSWPKGDEPVNVEPKKSVETLLDCMAVAIKTAVKNKQHVGFVMDIDNDVKSRWASVKSRLKNAGVNVDEFQPDEDGLIIPCGEMNVGVWLMPDNVSPKGRLEEFLAMLIPSDDDHYGLARSYVARAVRVENGPKAFRPKDAAKAELAAYLAVKDPPGITYGNAIKARVFAAPSETAERFVSWFKKLYKM